MRIINIEILCKLVKSWWKNLDWEFWNFLKYHYYQNFPFCEQRVLDIINCYKISGMIPLTLHIYFPYSFHYISIYFPYFFVVVIKIKMLDCYTQRELAAISVIYMYSVPNRFRSQKISFQFILCIERYLSKRENWY